MAIIERQNEQSTLDKLSAQRKNKVIIRSACERVTCQKPRNRFPFRGHISYQ